MIRRLKDGTEVPELTEPVILTVKTKCPEKNLAGIGEVRFV